MEKRKKFRIKTHSAAKLVSSTELKRLYGYLDNLCEDGMGIITPDQVMPGARFTCGFFLGDSLNRINTVATLVHTEAGSDTINYYGFRFDYISTEDRKMISSFIDQTAQKSV